MSKQYQTKTEQVYDTLREEILSGKLAPGARLPLIELANRFQLSTIPVREAIRMLSRDKLVDIRNHRGAAVAQLVIHRATEIVETRLWLEVYAALLALQHHDEASIAKLNAMHEQMRQYSSTSSGVRFSELNRRFHTALYAPGENQSLLRLISDLWDQVWRDDRSGSIIEADQDRMIAACTEHARIISAIQRKDRSALEAAMRVHLTKTVECWHLVAGEMAEPNGDAPEKKKPARASKRAKLNA